ncbi:hypothetical protein ACP4OV_022683 [Aristida adscensionis]
MSAARPILPVATPPGGYSSASSSPLEQWTKRFQEAERLAGDVAGLVAEREGVPASLPRELQRRAGEIRRKVAILSTRLDMLREDLSDLPKKQNMSLKELRKLAEKLSGLSSKAKEVGGQFASKYFSDRESSENCAKIDIKTTADMDNREIVDLQRQVMKEQDEKLDILGETITSTKHIALAINEELDLQTRLIEDLDERVEDTSNQLQRAQKRLKFLNMRMRKGGCCLGLLLPFIAVVICVAVIWALITIKH